MMIRLLSVRLHLGSRFGLCVVSERIQASRCAVDQWTGLWLC